MSGNASLNTNAITEMLSGLNDRISDFASDIVINSAILFGIGIALAAIVGLFGYKMIKLLLSLSMAYLGYGIGIELYKLMAEKISNAPQWMEYVCGGLLAVLFLCMAFAKFSYIWFGCATILGFTVMTVLIPAPYTWVMIGGALILGLLSVMLIRTMFVLTTSLLASTLCVNFLSQILTKWSFLRIGESAYALYVVAALAVIFALVQFISNRYRGETLV
ncbi:MAG: hypothetical protein IJX62_09345 [Clostridia bacterium]|nr:hypothetical protein [Clostridia bacterium]